MKHLDLFILLSLPVAIAFGQAAAAKPEPANLPRSIEQIRPSVARIVVKYQYSVLEHPGSIQTVTANGTGIVIDGAGHVATTANALNMEIIKADALKHFDSLQPPLHLNVDSFRRTAIVVSFPSPDVKVDAKANPYFDLPDQLQAEVFKQDDSHGLVILKCSPDPLHNGSKNGKKKPAPVPSFQEEPPHDGDMIAVSGFPFALPIMATVPGWIASSFFRDERGRTMYLGSVLTNGGDFGAPAYNVPDGRVIGIVVDHRIAPEGNSGLTVIFPIRQVLAFLANPGH